MKLSKGLIYKVSAIIIVLIIYFCVPTVKNDISKVVVMLSTLDMASLKEYLKSFHALGPMVSILLMMFQSIAAPLPAFILTFTNAWLYGWVYGAILSWSGAMLGATLCFYISKVYGRPVSEKIVSAKALRATDKFFDKYGKFAILIARLLPFISFDAISYAAGLTNMTFWGFFISTGIGQLPATIVYSKVGENLDNTSKFILWTICGVLVLIVFAFAIKKYISSRSKKYN